MTFPEPNWYDLIIAVVAAAVGWIANWLGIWKAPTRKE